MNAELAESAPEDRTLLIDGGWVLRRVADSGIELSGPAPDSLRRLRQLLAWGPLLDPAWSTTPVRLMEDAPFPTLLFQDPGGEPLMDLLARRWTVDQFLDVAPSMAQALAELHGRGLLHQCLQPASFLLDTAHHRAWLTGFFHASDLDGALREPAAAQQGLYSAPEQTGLMHRAIDQRSDLYALGACFYHMLTGEPPFPGASPVEIVHAHLARAPVPVGTKVPHIPEPMSAMVSRLLAKAPEGRYQTAAGLVADLRLCADTWRREGHLGPMVLGSADIPAQLVLPNRLHGREHETQALQSVMRDVVAGGLSRLVLVSGPAGVGKSSLVRGLQRSGLPLAARFVYAKAAPQLHDSPYAVLVQALQGVLGGILGLPDRDLHPWRQALHQAVGTHAALACALVPDLSHLLEPFTPGPTQAPAEQLVLTQRLMQDLLQVFAVPREPLILLIDDLQWLDAASLALIERLLGDTGVRSLLIVGAYRNQELASNDPLSGCLPRWKRLDPAPMEITLRPLRASELTSWVVDALRCKPSPAQRLARLVKQRTGGNPLFAAQLLANLVERGLIRFDVGSGNWSWNLSEIAAVANADSVVELMVDKLVRQPGATQALLATLSCLGTAVPPALLARACDVEEAVLRRGLLPALSAGLLRTIEPEVAFVHDRVRESALVLVPGTERAQRHLAIARRLDARPNADDHDIDPFLVVGQYNLGANALSRRGDIDHVARLNLIAAQRARSMGAPSSAMSHASAALALLQRSPGERDLELAHELKLLRAECAVLCGDFERAEQDLNDLGGTITGKTRAAAVCRQRVVLQVIRSDYTTAVQTALTGLRPFGIDLSPHPSSDTVDAGYRNVLRLLGDRTVESLTALPACHDAETHAAMDLLSELFAPACFTDPGLALLHLCEMVRLSLTRGVTPASGHGFAWFGILIGQTFGAYREGHRFAHLAQQLAMQHGHTGFEAKALFAVEIASVWTRPLGEALEVAKSAFTVGAAQGDIAIACFASHHAVNNMLVRGDALEDVAQSIEQGLLYVQRARFCDVEDELLAQQRFVASLRGQTQRPGAFDGEGFTEAGMEAALTPARMPTMAFWYWVLKAQARFYADEIEEASAALAHAEPLLWSAVHVQVLNFELFSGLIAARTGNAARVRAARDRFLQWKTPDTRTFDDKLLLLDAELARLDGRFEDAASGYEQAIATARAVGARPYEALAAWIGGRFMVQRGLHSSAHGLLLHARGAFGRWGASAVACRIEDEMSALGVALPPAASSTLDRMELGAVMTLAQALAAEIDLTRLVDTLMRLALEHAGASRGLLLRPEGDVLTVEARATLQGDELQVDVERSSVPQHDVPWNLVLYVARTRRSVVVDDAADWHAFASDPDLAARRPRSVLCLPLVRQSRLVGVLYLENGLSSHVFSSERTQLLELLASQAAIALENARLYEDLTREIDERRRAEAETLRVNNALRESENRFRMMAETSHDVIWITDLHPERVLYASPSFERIWGLSVRDLYADARLWSSGIHVDDRQRVNEAFGHWIERNPQGTWEAEFRVVSPGGEVRWIHDRGAVVLDDEGKPCRVGGIATDITARRDAESALRASEQRFSLAVAGARDGVWDMDFDSEQMFMSARAQQIFGLDPGETSRTRAAWLAAIAVHPDDEAIRQSTMDDHLEGRTPLFDGEWRVRMHDGHYRWVRVRGLCVRHEDGRPQRLAGSVSDVDEQKRAQASLQQTQRLEAVGTMASGIAHDFNNILGAILGFGEMCLDRTQPGSRLRRDIECIVTAGERGRALVERILAFSRSGASERVPVHMEGVVREALQLLSPTLPANVRLETRFEVGLAAVLGDSTQMHQVLVNLITNAVHAMPDGGKLTVCLREARVSAPFTATTGTIPAGEHVVLSVSDTGTGIAPGVRERIFDPFVTTRKDGSGSGLGLSLVHGIVTESGGAVDVTSGVGRGSRFDVYLPRCGQATATLPIATAAPPRGRHQQVMVVDDEPMLMRLATEALAELGYVVVGFTNPVEAADAFAAHPERFDALVTDERMPDLPGTDLIERVRTLRADLPVVLMSGFLGPQTAARARQRGVQVLGKPVTRHALASALEKALSESAVAASLEFQEFAAPPASTPLR